MDCLASPPHDNIVECSFYGEIRLDVVSRVIPNTLIAVTKY